jgi:3-hydroxymyristoyl/3-hydroxydecanoyl-(acyl carrier protein) dehydratase
LQKLCVAAGAKQARFTRTALPGEKSGNQARTTARRGFEHFPKKT